jgi:hypothetical protein
MKSKPPSSPRPSKPGPKSPSPSTKGPRHSQTKIPHPTWRHTGKVARLPKAIRDQLNQMLLDGVTYANIIKNLGEYGQGLTLSNLSRWKDTGHQDWLTEQAFIDRTRSRQETPAELVRDFDGTDVNHAALQLGSLHIFEALRDLRPGSLNRKLGGDCAAFARLLNALARASRETMLLQKYREACARARAALRELKDPKRKLTEDERRAIVRNVDDILGLSSEDDEQSSSSAVASAKAEVQPVRHSPGEGGSPQSTDQSPPEEPAAVAG